MYKRQMLNSKAIVRHPTNTISNRRASFEFYIKKNGYIPDSNNYVEVELLVKGNEFCWKPSGEGNHRATVISSLGIKSLKAVVSKVIRFY